MIHIYHSLHYWRKDKKTNIHRVPEYNIISDTHEVDLRASDLMELYIFIDYEWDGNSKHR